MLHSEFEKLTGRTISKEDYDIIDFVYTWHPAIKDTTGKEQMSILYNEFGMSVIRAMVPVAEKMHEIDREERALNTRMEIIRQRKKNLADGNMEIENAREAVKDLYFKSDSAREYEENLSKLDIDGKLLETAKIATGF